MRVFFDTNVLVSAVATRGICADILNVALGEHALTVGETVLAELRVVLRKKLRLPVSIIDEFESFLRLHAVVTSNPPGPGLPGLDENDRAVLGEAAGCDVLVTGDQDLLVLDGRQAVRILSPRGFWEMLRGG